VKKELPTETIRKITAKIKMINEYRDEEFDGFGIS